MEDTLGECWIYNDAKVYDVLILVLMEDTLGVSLILVKRPIE